jgi:D-alanine-D-alanine ligase
MKIMALIDAEACDRDDPQFDKSSQTENRSMEFYVVSALRSLNHQVTVAPFEADPFRTIEVLNAGGFDLVFNLTEHMLGDRSKDAQIAALLDLLQIPYTGTGPTGLILCRDKALAKQVLTSRDILVPAFESLTATSGLRAVKLRFPVLIKPQMGDGSEGISLNSLAKSEAGMVKRIRQLRAMMQQPIICEEYIDGRELKVCILGNRRLHMFPPREIIFGSKERKAPRIATNRVKADLQYRKKWQISYPRAKLSRTVAFRVAGVARRIYRLLQIRDYGKIDLRLTPTGNVYFIEANPNPDISPTGFGTFASWGGINYVNLIDRIVRLAIQRHRETSP